MQVVILYLIPYNPQLNPIEQYFNQIKHYLKLNKQVLKYDELAIEIINVKTDGNICYC